jgi:hypothetical protein
MKVIRPPWSTTATDLGFVDGMPLLDYNTKKTDAATPRIEVYEVSREHKEYKV